MVPCNINYAIKGLGKLLDPTSASADVGRTSCWFVGDWPQQWLVVCIIGVVVGWRPCCSAHIPHTVRP
jgi:hypothetical protein